MVFETTVPLSNSPAIANATSTIITTTARWLHRDLSLNMSAPLVPSGIYRRPTLDLIVCFRNTSSHFLLICIFALTVGSQSDEDFVFEQEILRNPGNVEAWLVYIHSKAEQGTPQEQVFILERACSQLPRSYKLWKMVCDSVSTRPETNELI